MIIEWLISNGYLLVIGGLVLLFVMVWLLGLALSAFFDVD